MLTEPQFKVLMILFDDNGHAGWELADDLGVKESNLNPYLKILEERKFIIQGKQRKSGKPKRREGDYKEIPYYLTKDPEIIGTIIEEMLVTNRVYDTGFPFRIIRRSNYFKNIKEFDINEFLANLSRNLQSNLQNKLVVAEMIESNVRYLKINFNKAYKIKILHSNSLLGKSSLIRKRKVTKRLLKDLERWWYLYNLRICCSQDPINIDELENILWDVPDNYILGNDILELIFSVVKKLPGHEDLSIWRDLNDMRRMLNEMPEDMDKKELFL
jgi:hypothetical protein